MPLAQMEDRDEHGQLPLSTRGFARLSDYIYKTLGIQMPATKQSMLRSRLQRRAKELRLLSIDAYCDLLLDGPDGHRELNAFISVVTTNKTDFFREPTHFEYLQNVVLSERARERQSEPLRVWCAGCSTGEEPYTTAMVLSDYATTHPSFDFEILATDISPRVLESAHVAMYNAEQIEPIPLPLRQRYLRRGSGEYEGWFRIAPALRSKVQLASLNLMDERYGLTQQFDVIFFRNVMIYFDKATQEAVVQRMCRNLRPGGILFIGHVESLTGLDLPITGVAPATFKRNANFGSREGR